MHRNANKNSINNEHGNNLELKTIRDPNCKSADNPNSSKLKSILSARSVPRTLMIF